MLSHLLLLLTKLKADDPAGGCVIGPGGGGGGGGGGSLFASSSLDCSIKLWDINGLSGAGASASDHCEWNCGWSDQSQDATISPVKEFRTKRTPVQTLRFGLTNIVYAAGATLEEGDD